MNIRRITVPDLIFYFLTAVLLIGLKLFFKQADERELTFILSPTVSIVEAFTGYTYIFHDSCGYRNDDLNVVIGKSCSGLHIFLITICMSVMSFIHLFGNIISKTLAFLLVLSGAYLFTFLTNSFRIISSLHLMHLHPAFGGDTMHEATGIFVYFFFLVFYFFLIKTLVHKIIYKHESPIETILDIPGH